MKNFIYIIENTGSSECVVVDAVSFFLTQSTECWDIDGILAYLKSQKLTLVGAILTHYHIDHCGGIPPAPFDKYRIRVDGLAKLLKKVPNIKAYIHPLDIPGVVEANPEIAMDRMHRVKDGDVLYLPMCANQSSKPTLNTSPVTILNFIHTPGHTPGSQCILVNGNRLFSGDTLFVGSCGRCDFPDSSTEQMTHSLSQKLSRLPDEVVVFPGHQYSGEWTTIGREKKHGVLGMSDHQCLH
jgi:glyoxylase-like metal-dependent hydrolase (beta-lactamase superfamily II)